MVVWSKCSVLFIIHCNQQSLGQQQFPDAFKTSELETVIQAGTLFAPTNVAFEMLMPDIARCHPNVTKFPDAPVDFQQAVLNFHFTQQTFQKQQLCSKPDWTIPSHDPSKFDPIIEGHVPYRSVDGLNGTVRGKFHYLKFVHKKGPDVCFYRDNWYANFAEVYFFFVDDYTGLGANADTRSMFDNIEFTIIPIDTVVLSSRALEALHTLCPPGQDLASDPAADLPPPQDIV